MKYMRGLLVILGWVLLLGIMTFIMTPTAIYIVESYGYLNLEVAIMTFTVLFITFFPVFYFLGMGIMALFAATIEVFDRD